jgi:hypothetical protein
MSSNSIKTAKILIFFQLKTARAGPQQNLGSDRIKVFRIILKKKFGQFRKKF